MLRILAQEFEKEGLDFCFLHGSVPSVKRKGLIDRFRDDPGCRIFLSTDAGSTGLNLQSASLLINIDLPWNPAILEQRVARIYRLGQENPVHIINMVASDTIEERMLDTLSFKSNLAAGILDGGEDAVFIDNNKFSKIVNVVESVVSEDATQETSATDDEVKAETAIAAPQATGPTAGNRAAENKESSSSHAPATEDTVSPQSGTTKIPDNARHTAYDGNHEKTRDTTPRQTPRTASEVKDFVADGMNFLGTLANMLREPEGAKTLADALVKEDPETGKASINIPVADKESVVSIFSAFASLLNHK